MKDRRKFSIVLRSIAAAALLASTASGAAAQMSCTDFQALVQGSLPGEVGNEGAIAALLNPPISQPQMGELMKDRNFVKNALRVIDARGLKADKADCRYDGRKPRRASKGEDPYDHIDCTQRSRKTGEVLRLRLADGHIVYLNPSRSYDAIAGNGNTQTIGDALARADEVAGAFGVPPAELSTTFRDAVAIKVAGVPLDFESGIPDLANAEVQVAELLALVGREVAGVPVHDSGMRVVIDAKGQVARMNIRWPDFCIDPEARAKLSSTLRSTQDVIADAVETMGEQNDCLTLAGIHQRIMYVRADIGGEGPETADDEGDPEEAEEGNTRPTACYVPALVIDVETIDYSGTGDEVQAGAEYIIPLIGAAAEQG